MKKNVNTYFKQHKALVILWVFVTGVVAILAPLKAFNLQWIIDSSSKTEAIIFVCVGSLVIIGSFIFEYFSRKIYTTISCKAEENLRNEIMKHIYSSEIASYQLEKNSSYISLLTNDLRTLYDDYFTSIFNFVFWGAILIVSLCMYFYINPMLLFVVCIASIPPLVIPKFINIKLRIARDEYSKKTAEYISCLNEQLSGLETIWNFLRKEYYLNAYTNITSMTRKTEENFQQKMNTATTVTSFMSNITFIIILVVGMFLVFDRKISMGYMVTACSLANFVITPCQILTQNFVKIKSTKGIREKLELQINLPIEKHTQNLNVSSLKQINCKNLSFSYPGYPKKVLDNINFNIKYPEKICIIGSSGSGKSTLAKLIHQYYLNYNGEIKINEQELNTLNQKNYFKKVGYISQDTFLFQDTIRNNISMYEIFSDVEFKRALTLAGLNKFISTLPNGLDTVIEKNGRNLSGGQKQRIAIARSVIRRYELIIADEITANLDKNTSEQVMENLLSLDCIVLVITHDTDGIFMKKFDKIYELENGKFK